MSKKKALKVHFKGQKWRSFEWQVTGNDPRTGSGPTSPWNNPNRQIVEASRWTGWSKYYHPLTALFRDADRKGIPVDHKSGKKEKKFWGKVMRRIERLAGKNEVYDE